MFNKILTTTGSLLANALVPFMVVLMATMILTIFIQCSNPLDEPHKGILVGGEVGPRTTQAE